MNSSAVRATLRRIDRGAIKAFADVTIDTAMGEVTLLGFRVIQQPGKDAWVGFPNTSYVKDGRTVNKALLDLTRSQQDRIADAVLAEFRRPPDAAPVAPLASRKTA